MKSNINLEKGAQELLDQSRAKMQLNLDLNVTHIVPFLLNVEGMLRD